MSTNNKNNKSQEFINKLKDALVHKECNKKHEYNLVRCITPIPVPPQNILKFNKNLKLPSRIDLRNKCPPVQDQGNLGSCTAHALLGIFQYDNLKFLGSRLFLYYNTRKYINTTGIDSGAYLHDGIDSLKKYGVCKEVIWPYIIPKFSQQPPKKCYQQGIKNKVLQAFQIKPNFDDMKACLNENEPFVFGFDVYDNFESFETTKNGFVSVPSSNNRILGGHAVVCVGYDDNLTYNGITGYWICRNSWGTGWGDKGYFYLPYDYLRIKDVFSDLWKITRSKTT